MRRTATAFAIVIALVVSTVAIVQAVTREPECIQADQVMREQVNRFGDTKVRTWNVGTNRDRVFYIIADGVVTHEVRDECATPTSTTTMPSSTTTQAPTTSTTEAPTTTSTTSEPPPGSTTSAPTTTSSPSTSTSTTTVAPTSSTAAPTTTTEAPPPSTTSSTTTTTSQAPDPYPTTSPTTDPPSTYPTVPPSDDHVPDCDGIPGPAASGVRSYDFGAGYNEFWICPGLGPGEYVSVIGDSAGAFTATLDGPLGLNGARKLYWEVTYAPGDGPLLENFRTGANATFLVIVADQPGTLTIDWLALRDYPEGY